MSKLSKLLQAQEALKAIQNADIARLKEVDPEGFKRREAELLDAQMEGRRRQQEAAEALAMRETLEQALQETRFRKAGQALLAAGTFKPYNKIFCTDGGPGCTCKLANHVNRGNSWRNMSRANSKQ